MYRIRLYQGSTSVYLDGSDSIYKITGARVQPVSGGGEVVEEQIEASMAGTVAECISALEAVGRMLSQAGLWKNPEIDPVYLGCQVSSGEAEQRARLRGGWAVSLGPGSGTRAKGSQAIRINITRENWWEGSESQIALTNGNGAGVTTALPVWNCADGTSIAPAIKHNYAEIAAGAVGGDLPAACRIEAVNNHNTLNLFDVWIGQNWTDPANSVQLYEGENGVTGTTDSGCSGGKYSAVTIDSGAETSLGSWTITAAALGAAKGQWVHGLLRFASEAWEASTKFRLVLSWSSGTVWSSDSIQPGALRMAIWDLFQFRLPPILMGLSSMDPLTLTLFGLQTSGVSKTINLDFLALVPADGWRYIRAIGAGLAKGYRVMDDGITGKLYSDNGAGAARVGNLAGYGEAIQLMPAVKQRLYFWQHSDTACTATIIMTLGVKVYYRPRRRVL